MLNRNMVFVIYSFVLILMAAAACLVAAGVLLPENGFLVAALVVGFVIAIIADFKFPKPED